MDDRFGLAARTAILGVVEICLRVLQCLIKSRGILLHHLDFGLGLAGTENEWNSLFFQAIESRFCRPERIGLMF